MLVLVKLNLDGNSYIRYTLVNIDINNEKTAADYLNQPSYTDDVILYQGKAYLNNRVISHPDKKYNLDCVSGFIYLSQEGIDYAESRGYYYCIFDDYISIHRETNVYYLFDTDGTNFPINEDLG